MSMPTMQTAPQAAGWFPDPTWPTQQRYFDGREWTHQVRSSDRMPQLVSMWPDARLIGLWVVGVSVITVGHRFLM